MREDTKITKVYRFEELSEEAQQKAMEKLADINVDCKWWDCVYDDAKTIGVKIEEFDLGRGGYCRGAFIRDELEVAEAILKEHGKDCETYKDAYEFVWTMAEAEDADYEEKRGDAAEAGEDFVWYAIDEFDPDAECPEELEEFQRTIFEDYRIMLQQDYDYLTSAKAIKDTIDANGYEFTEDGRIY